jgi:hypothetical protein
MAEIILLRLLVLIGAIALGYWVYKKITYNMWEGKEELRLLKKAVEIAKATNGYITAADLSFSLEIPMGQADTILNKLVEEGLATATVEETGTLLYDVPRARPEDKKQQVPRSLA